METIQDRLALIKERKGIRNRDIAQALGITDASVSQFCSGRTQPSSQTIDQIAEKFNINADWLRTGEGKPEPPAPDLSEAEEMAAHMGKLMRDYNPQVAQETVDRICQCIRSIPPEVTWMFFRELQKAFGLPPKE